MSLVAAAPASAQPAAPDVPTGQLVWSTSTPFIHVHARLDGTETDLFLGTGGGGASLDEGRYEIRGGPRFAGLWPTRTLVSVRADSVTRISIEYVSGAELTISGASLLLAALGLAATGLGLAAANNPIEAIDCCAPEVTGLFIGAGVAAATALLLIWLGVDVQGLRVRTLSASVEAG